MKKCTSCKEFKNESDFSKKSERKDGLQSSCKVCNSVASKQYYSKNKDKHKKTIKRNKKKYTEKTRKWVYQYYLDNHCVDCGEDNPIVLEFDHIKGSKINSISRMISNNFSLSNIKKEIDD